MYELTFLPKEYDYKILENTDEKLVFRIKNVVNEEQAKSWLQRYQDRTKTTWRVARTHKSTGTYNVYRTDLRCQRGIPKRFRPVSSEGTKNTGCKASLKLVIHRYFEVKNLKSPTEEVKQFPCHVELYHVHNHYIDSAAVLSTSLDNEGSEELSDSEDVLSTSLDNEGSEESSDSEDDVKELDDLFARIKECRKKNPSAFKPAIKQMTTNAKMFAASDNALLKAMHFFGQYLLPTSLLITQKSRRGVNIPIQPTA